MRMVLGLDAVPADSGLPLLRRAQQLAVANMKAALRYEPGVYPHRLTLLRTTSTRAEDPTLGWARWTPQPVDVHEISGDHFTMLADPHVRVLAERLQGCLAGIG